MMMNYLFYSTEYGYLPLFTLVAMATIVYHHVGYPVLLKFWGKKKNTQKNKPIKSCHLPSISIIMPAYNEQAYIEAKIYNLGSLNYPSNKLTIYIVCDGCSDLTFFKAKRALKQPENRHLHVELINLEKNIGKVAIINNMMEKVESDWVALTDVSALISIDAFLIASQHMHRADPAEKPIGVICSHYQVINPGSTGEEVYWQYQCNIKQREANIESTLGAHGALYLFKSELYTPLSETIINDDFVLPMQIVAKGYRNIYLPNMNAIELEKASDEQDSHRRRRISAGNIQQLLTLYRILLGQAGARVAIIFISGKYLRVLMPLFMIFCLISNGFLYDCNLFFTVLLILQLTAYLCALVGYLWGKQSPFIFKTAQYIVSGHLSNLLGAMEYLRSRETHFIQKNS
ncbi:glycosyltransferase family 2 protein [Aliivibrio kagoshimensis]|uniref:glycosyltransferase family 2 protein n=1 Tax=Aliivibrio kagoshimensis TaxID=2910230 RepID=UPI003D10DF1A